MHQTRLLRYIVLVSDDLHLEEQATMTIAQQMRREGREQGLEEGLERGLEQGREQGLHEGRVTMLTKLLMLKFGDLSQAHQTLIAEASAEQLERYIERVLTAQSIDALFESPVSS